MHDTHLTRRGVLGLAAMAAVGFATTAHAQAVCLDMAALPASQKAMRKSLGFQEQSSDPKKRCAMCSFFTARGSSCGTCLLLSGGAVNPTSVCTSWAAKG